VTGPAVDLAARWASDGYVILRSFVPDEVTDRYIKVRAPLGPAGWPHPTPYMDCDELRDLCCFPPLAKVIETLIGEPAGVHLNLTGWLSSQRNWHQDGYLNPDHVGDAYAAVWVALGDIHPDSGPFQYVPGSHLWAGRLSRADAMALGTPEQRAAGDWDHRWPKHTEPAVSAYWAERIAEHGTAIEAFDTARKGDVLVWSPWLVHRGSPPAAPGMERRALIAHYSGLDHRHDMPHRAQHPGGGWYYQLPVQGVV
jgi:ectoine hydroxylase-related dioxygenase (phytanoyl-CoA dioxygenase family)